MVKYFGAAVSGYLDPSGRNFESTVSQAGKPVLDKELNLAEDIAEGFSQGLAQRMPSGWLADDFLGTSSASSGIFTASVVANQLAMPNNLVAQVNGWTFLIAHTNANGSNKLDMGAAPAGAGANRTDLVVLEVWRALISASPNATNKSPAGRIWKNGNVKVTSGNDLALNYADDILDVNVGLETTKRVQLQYRLRVLHGVDLFATPYGLDDPTVVANSIPTNAATPDGVATLFAYDNQSPSGDPGLWLAGDGDPTNTLGTVDGYMYAIPLLAVFRRNTTAFARNTNHNGGVASPGPSDRPDGLFHDIFAAKDVADLRHAVSPSGWDYRELLEKSFNALLDNSIQTDWTSTVIGGGSNGHTVLWADSIGISNANGGDGTTTGSTPGAAFIGEFDAARRSFSDRVIYEIITVAVPAPGGGWVDGSVVTIDPTALAIYPYPAFNWASYNPASVSFVDYLGAQWIGDGSGKVTRDAINGVYFVTGLGEVPVNTITITMGILFGFGLTNETLYVDLLVAYPAGIGLSKTPTTSFGAASFEVNNPLALPAPSPISFSALASTNAIDAPHREVRLQYNTSTITLTMDADTTQIATRYRLPERAESIVSVLKNGSPISGTTSLHFSGRYFDFTTESTTPGDVLDISYVAIRPLPQNGEQLTVYYEARAPQTARSELLGMTLTLTPRLVGESLFAFSTGSGSQDEGYPFPFAYVQVGGIYPTDGGSFNGDHELTGSKQLSVMNFNASTGFLKLPLYVPFVPSPEAMTFDRDLVDTDIEGRSFFKSVPGGYTPNAYAQSLSDAKTHRDVLPVLAELSSDSPLGFRGQLVLVMLVRNAPLDDGNWVAFDSNLSLNTTTAGVVRIKGNPLSRRF